MTPSDMHTIELLLDPVLEAGVRELWDLLRDAGLSSLAAHPHPTNRPHLTVLTAASLAGFPPPALPIPAELGPVRFLGRTLVREVTPTPGSGACTPGPGPRWPARRHRPSTGIARNGRFWQAERGLGRGIAWETCWWP
jgi:hypothetical protein